MSYLSASENGYSGIAQNISDARCASKYKMAVESVSGGCSSGVNMYIQDSSGDEGSYITQISDNFFHNKFKIDPNELYTFHDSDVIAGEITVSHTDDNYIFPESSDLKSKCSGNSTKDIDILGSLTNGDVKSEKKETVNNGQYSKILNDIAVNQIESKSTHVKVQKARNPVLRNFTDINHSVPSSTSLNKVTGSVTSNPKAVVSNGKNVEKTAPSIKSPSETFLDVFKREQGVTENATIKNEPIQNPIKAPAPVRKQSTGKTKSSTPARSRRGRGPAVHEALQRIPLQRNAVAVRNTPWRAPGSEMFECGPLSDIEPNVYRELDSGSSDDEMPDFDPVSGPSCVEESAAESRGARLALRRAALRRRRRPRRAPPPARLAALLRDQLAGRTASWRLPTRTVNRLLATRGMSSVLSPRERRWLRQRGWSSGESARGGSGTCTEERCTRPPLPSGRYCLSHVTLAAEQRLYAPCAAVFAGGERCKQPLLPLHEQTPLCAEHAWKRDNYELLSRESKPKSVRKRACPARPPRPAPRGPAPARTHAHALTDINVCSNSSAYDSAEETPVGGGVSETEYMTTTNPHDLEVGQVPPDDILDPSVLSQIPDEEFTEFFNQEESGAPFGESSELAAALEAVLGERTLDIDVFPCVKKMSVGAESTSAPS